mmetsp:Transcript_30069/g.21816  ORF Transcript_30069/g.21816 Transcript_30069/m.21816 type:complete len:83 (+) Transcript_30069:778-1026(+)
MAPELLEKSFYIDARATDIFSSGVVLFVMVTGAYPFSKKASANDPVYSFIVKKDFCNFWKSWTTQGLSLSRAAVAKGSNMPH